VHGDIDRGEVDQDNSSTEKGDDLVGIGGLGALLDNIESSVLLEDEEGTKTVDSSETEDPDVDFPFTTIVSIDIDENVKTPDDDFDGAQPQGLRESDVGSIDAVGGDNSDGGITTIKNARGVEDRSIVPVVSAYSLPEVSKQNTPLEDTTSKENRGESSGNTSRMAVSEEKGETNDGEGNDVAVEKVVLLIPGVIVAGRKVGVKGRFSRVLNVFSAGPEDDAKGNLEEEEKSSIGSLESSGSSGHFYSCISK